MAALEARSVRANGQRLHTVSCGEGPLVLLVHGFPESWYSWRHQLPALAEAGYRAVAYDQRGYGRSSKPAALEAYAIEHLVEDAAALVSALGESEAVIVGHDWGAPVAWTGAWIKPEVFRAVAGLSVPFGGRGMTTPALDPFGTRRPSEVDDELSGPGKLYYQTYFSLPGGVAEAEAEQDMRSYITAVLYGLSGTPPLPPPLDQMDLLNLPDEVLMQVLQGAVCVEEGQGMMSVLTVPDELPEWLSADDLEYFVGEFERTGLTGGLNYYRNVDRSWEWLAPFAGRTIDVPSKFIGADRDIVTIWSRAARERQGELRTDIRDDVILQGSIGHWIQQEDPAGTNAALLDFLGGL